MFKKALKLIIVLSLSMMLFSCAKKLELEVTATLDGKPATEAKVRSWSYPERLAPTSRQGHRHSRADTSTPAFPLEAWHALPSGTRRRSRRASARGPPGCPLAGRRPRPPERCRRPTRPPSPERHPSARWSGVRFARLVFRQVSCSTMPSCDPGAGLGCGPCHRGTVCGRTDEVSLQA